MPRGVIRDGSLSRREWQVMQMRALGHSESEVAGALNLSRSTVHNYVQNAYKKLDVTNLPEALVALGWLQVPSVRRLLLR